MKLLEMDPAIGRYGPPPTQAQAAQMRLDLFAEPAKTMILHGATSTYDWEGHKERMKQIREQFQ